MAVYPTDRNSNKPQSVFPGHIIDLLLTKASMLPFVRGDKRDVP